MVPSRTLVVAGMRTAPGVGRRADIGAALAVVRDRPSMILRGIIGFALRGGIVLLTLPILVLPTQVEVRFALGDNLNSSGLTGGFWSLVAVFAAVAVIVALGAIYVLARLEVDSFVTVVEHPASLSQRGGVRAARRRWQAAARDHMASVHRPGTRAVARTAGRIAAWRGNRRCHAGRDPASVLDRLDLRPHRRPGPPAALHLPRRADQ